MGRSGKARPGQPLVALVGLLLGWTALRMIVAQHDGESARPRPADAAAIASAAHRGVAGLDPAGVARGGATRAGLLAVASVAPARPSGPRVLPARAAGTAVPAVSAPRAIAPTDAVADPAAPPPRWAPLRVARPEEPPKRSSWSADSWLVLRGGGIGDTPFAARYGASQIGAVLRYRLADTRSTPTLYLRGTAALQVGERELAAGLALRPVPGVPVIAYAEVRAMRQPGGVLIRPAFGAVTALPPAVLPGGWTGEAYGQAGWVGGGAATGFAEGQVRIERALERVGDNGWRMGLGAWAAHQRGATRLDLGPLLARPVRLGSQGFARIEAEWRMRLAGNAAPGSGPAVVLAAGF